MPPENPASSSLTSRQRSFNLFEPWEVEIRLDSRPPTPPLCGGTVCSSDSDALGNSRQEAGALLSVSEEIASCSALSRCRRGTRVRRPCAATPWRRVPPPQQRRFHHACPWWRTMFRRAASSRLDNPHPAKRRKKPICRLRLDTLQERVVPSISVLRVCPDTARCERPLRRR